RFPAYWLQYNPGERVIVAAYNQLLANKFSRKTRRIAAGRIALAGDRTAVEDWETTAGGGYRAVGVGAGVTGQGGNLILIDDPVKSREEAESEAYRDRVWEWYTDDLFSRREPDAVMILIITRWHEDDLAGRILASEHGKQWTVLSLPALAEPGDPMGRKPGQALCPDRYPVKALEEIRQVQTPYTWAALYQQRPAPLEGGIFKRVWWRFWQPPDRHLPPVEIRKPDGSMHRVAPVTLPFRIEREALSWDMTFKDTKGSDFVVGQHWRKAGADAFLGADQVRDRMDFPETVESVRAFAAAHGAAAAKYVEDKANGPAVIATLRHQVPGLIAVDPRGGKVARAHAVAPYVKAGNVYLPHPSMAPWVLDLIERAAAFPNIKFDDEIDAMTQALLQLMGAVPVNPDDFPPARPHV
ncbi:MAG TPA: phage terminase large subunit, partial [Gemmatimonadales bacterium]|nr:phage terminase large subunit [Gemmatimonadales bacterium]